MANFADYGFRAAIPKPFDKDSLYEAIRRVLDQE
jgi:hypothetical protein